MRDLIYELGQLGFTKKEAAIYLAALELGAASAQKIGKKSDINRATTYSILESLARKGLVTLITDSGQKLYRAESPDGILTLLEVQKKEIQRRQQKAQLLIERLQVFHNKDSAKPMIRYVERVTGLRSMQMEYERLTDDIIQIVGLDTLKKLYDVSSDTDHVKEVIKSERRIRAIVTTDQDVSYLGDLGVDYIAVPNGVLDIKGEMTVCGDRLLMFSYSGGIIAIEVHSQTIADTAKATLELAWREAKRLVGE